MYLDQDHPKKCEHTKTFQTSSSILEKTLNTVFQIVAEESLLHWRWFYYKKVEHGIDTMIKFWCILQRNFMLYIESNYLSYFRFFINSYLTNGLCTRGLMAKCNISFTKSFLTKVLQKYKMKTSWKEWQQKEYFVFS